MKKNKLEELTTYTVIVALLFKHNYFIDYFV